jgi:hypothetical protein
MNRDHEWIRTHLEKLVKEHPGNYVAVLDGKVIASDKSGVRVREEAKRKYPDKKPSVLRIPREEDFNCLLLSSSIPTSKTRRYH